MTAITMTLAVATAAAQNTQVTIEGVITNAGTVPGIAVGDKYSMVVSYNPSQAPSSESGTQDSNYTQFTLNAVVDDKNGNQSFSAAGTDEYLSVSDIDNYFLARSAAPQPPLDSSCKAAMLQHSRAMLCPPS